MDTTQQIANTEEKVRALVEVAGVRVRLGDLPGALLILQIAVKHAKQIKSTLRRHYVFRDIAETWLRTDDLLGARKAFQSARLAAEQSKGGWRLTASLVHLAEVQAQAGVGVNETLQSALMLANRHKAERKVSALTSIAKVQVIADDLVGARKVLKSALKTAERIEPATSQAYDLKDIANTQAQAGDVPGASETFRIALTAAERIKDADKKAKAVSDIVRTNLRTGDIAGALSNAEGLKSIHVREIALRTIAAGLARNGDLFGTPGTLLRLRMAVERVGDDSSTVFNLLYVARAQARAGDLSAARKTFQTALKSADQIEDAQWKDSEIARIADARAKVGDLPGALATSELLKNNLKKNNAFLKIADIQAKAGDLIGASETFQRALEAAERVESPYSRAYYLRQIAGAVVMVGDLSGALAVVERLQRPYTRAMALAEISRALVMGK